MSRHEPNPVGGLDIDAFLLAFCAGALLWIAYDARRNVHEVRKTLKLERARRGRAEELAETRTGQLDGALAAISRLKADDPEPEPEPA